jgi:transposase
MGREVKRRHNKSFREQACKLVTEQGHSVSEAARELGIPRMTLWNWLTENGERSLSSQEQERRVGEDPAAMRIRIKELEQRVHQLEMEKQILKKAAAFFAQESQP